MEYKTIPMTVSANCDGHDDTIVTADEGYNVIFSTDSGATVNVYNTQDYTTTSATNAKTAVSRNSDTGLPDSTGEGQVNFTVVLKIGYELDSVTVTGGYKNLKDVSTDTLPNTYRVTKVTSDLTITVKTKSSATALSNDSTLSATSISLGNKVTVNAKATGGTGSYTYAVYYKQTAQTSWTTAQNFNTNATVTFKPAKATTYDVCVKVKDSAGTVEKQYFTVTVKNNALVNNSELSATDITLGTKITATGKATGGSGTYQYQVVYKQTSQTKWTTAQSFSTNSTVTFKPAKATTYDVCVKVKDSAGTIVKKFFTVTVSQGLTNSSVLSSTSITLGNTVTVTGKASGGTGYYNYAVYYKRTSQSAWTTAQNFASNAKVTFKPAAATTYDVCIKVKDSDGTIVKKYLTLTVSK